MNTPQQYDWIGFYQELADRLLEYKSKRAELIAVVKQIFANIGQELPTLEKNNELVDFEPFTFFALFNKGIKNETRIDILRQVKDIMGIKAALPTDFWGIPTLTARKATFYHFVGDRAADDMDNLWDIFEKALAFTDHETAETKAAFAESFNRVMHQKGIKWNITMGLFWIRPNAFFSLDGRNRWYLDQKTFIDLKTEKPLEKYQEIDADEYLSINERIREACKKGVDGITSLAALSHQGYLRSEEVNQALKAQKKKDPKPVQSVDKAWFVGTMWDARNEQMPRFRKEGIWQDGGPEDAKLVNRMQPGDKLVVKAAYTQKKGLPFDIKGQTASVMSIRVIGTITKNRGDGRTVEVKWEDSFEPYKLWYFYTARDTVWEVERSAEEWRKGALLDFVFANKEQDYDAFLQHPYWKELYKLDTPDTPEIITEAPKAESYSKADFLSEVYMTADRYDELEALLQRKKNIILQGAPGVGKTFAAQRLAYAIMGEKNPLRVQQVQFHQNYSYEDFIMGYKPNENGGFKLEAGVFYNFCERARQDEAEGKPYFFIIDEINRGNLSKIFGELMQLIEGGYRGKSIALAYNKQPFSVPANLYLIGMMNTADRSLAMIDYALRRRFAFYSMQPAFDTDAFRAYQKSLKSPKFDHLIQTIELLNEDIMADASLGAGFLIGHSFFCELDAATVGDSLESIVRYDIVPTLEEYWFDNETKVKEWENKLLSAIK